MSTQTTIDSDELFIGGDWIAPQGSERITVIAASTEELVGSVPEGTNADIDAAVGAARRGVRRPERLVVLVGRGPRAGARAAGRRDGKPRRGDRAPRLDAERHADLVRARGRGGLPAGARALLRRHDPPDEPWKRPRQGLLGGTINVVSKPVGVVGAIVPWNYPQTLAMFKLAPLLAAGCTVVIKPSPGDGARQPAARRGDRRGRAPGAASSTSCPPVARSARTSSSTRASTRSPSPAPRAAGRTIAERCGELLRPVTLELGGKSAAIVLDDADLVAGDRSAVRRDAAEQRPDLLHRHAGARARDRATTRSCDVFAGLAGALQVGDALDPATQIGPLASARQRDRVEGYIAKGRPRARASSPEAVDRRTWIGAGSCSRRSSPTSQNGHTIAREEIFGPVLVGDPLRRRGRGRRDRQRLRVRPRRQRLDGRSERAEPLRGAFRPAASGSTTTCSIRLRRSAA